MVAIILFAVVGFLMLTLLLARYAPSPHLERARLRQGGQAELPRMPAERLRALVVELLGAMGMTEEAPAERSETHRRLVMLRRDPFRDARYVVFIEASPPGDLVEQSIVLELVETVKSEHASVGLLVTPWRIERSGLGGLEVPVEFLDGARLRDLVSRYLPHRLEELDRHAGFGAAMEHVILPHLLQPIA